MESFIKFVDEKKVASEATSDCLHDENIERLKQCVRECKNVFVCGASGVGKTFMVQRTLEILGENPVEVLPEHCRGKSNFLFFVRNTDKILLMEEYDSEPLLKALVDRVSSNTEDRLSRGSLIVISQKFCMYPNFETILVKKPLPEEILRVWPGHAREAAQCRGNIRDFLSYIEGYDDKDIFTSSKDIVIEILTGDRRCYAKDSLCEHGQLMDIFHENYPDSKGAVLEACARSFSDADMFDTVMYNGDWNMMPYFVNVALRVPMNYIKQPLKADKIRSGSSWTKHGNAKMRAQKVKRIHDDARPMYLGVDELNLLHLHAKLRHMDILRTYSITPASLDVMNHLSLMSRLKQRELMNIKKALKDELEKFEGG
ncbi:hypothetical protein DSLPV1_017 [Dishui lake phycodnavirus 1]|uniref:hypothetical protein n=1 Tax=Dishui lake phycodnavirus 1 TaxID=2079134 RepID=UPI000CD69B2F|nr:hypothetical protein C5Y57_gp017 [Dishui lake phycodnavirus 1]AUT18988.1 hypothetical protein DSLPV1_017 [Dishui lake phycodnavirus 1]